MSLADRCGSRRSVPEDAFSMPSEEQRRLRRNWPADTARSSGPSALRRCGMRLAAVALGIAAALLVAEAALRLAGYEPSRIQGKLLLKEEFAPRFFHCYSSNPNGEF